MIALDTNVVLRLFIGDDPGQEAAAGRLFAQAARDGTRLYIADAVLCEVAWVCRARYKMNRGETAQLLAELLRTERVVVQDGQGLDAAIEGYREGPGDFSDYLIRARAAAIGVREVVTFDKALKGEDGFRVLVG